MNLDSEERKMDDRSLSRLIELAKGVNMSESQSTEQRNSFVYGNTKIENSEVTFELVEKISHEVPINLDDVRRRNVG